MRHHITTPGERGAPVEKVESAVSGAYCTRYAFRISATTGSVFWPKYCWLRVVDRTRCPLEPVSRARFEFWLARRAPTRVQRKEK